MNARKIIFLVVSFGITGLALWLATRNIDWGRFGQSFADYELIWLLPGFFFFYYSMYLRAVRWALLFRPHHVFKGHQVFSPMMVCFGLNSVLPGRVGEFARAYLIGKNKDTGISTAVATVVTERIFDGVVLLGLLAGCFMVLPPIDPEFSWTQYGFTLTGEQLSALTRKLTLASGVLAAGVVVFMIPWTQLTIIRVIRALGFIPGNLRHALVNLVGQFAKGFHALAQPWPLVQIIFHSLFLWVLVGASNWVLAFGFGLEVSFVQAMALVTLIGIFILIPAAPGYWGLYEAGGLFSLIIMGIIEPDTEGLSIGLAYILLTHIVQYVPIVIIGLTCAWREQGGIMNASRLKE